MDTQSAGLHAHILAEAAEEAENNQSMEVARDPDLRLPAPAMRRAAPRAHQLAIQTQTDLVVSEHGVPRKIHSTALPASQQAQASSRRLLPPRMAG